MRGRIGQMPGSVPDLHTFMIDVTTGSLQAQAWGSSIFPGSSSPKTQYTNRGATPAEIPFPMLNVVYQLFKIQWLYFPHSDRRWNKPQSEHSDQFSIIANLLNSPSITAVKMMPVVIFHNWLEASATSTDTYIISVGWFPFQLISQDKTNKPW